MKEDKDIIKDYIDNDNREDLINTMLDIENYFGESSSRTAPTLITICLCCIPICIYLYYFIGIIPLKYFLPIYIWYCIRVCMIVLGDEKKRLLQYKKQMFDIYSSSYELMKIKKIHDNGCIEYTDGIIKYLIVTTNGAVEDKNIKSMKIRKFLSKIMTNYSVDIYIQNEIEADDMYNRYTAVNMFNDNDVMEDYINIVDYTRKKIEESYLVTKTIFAVSGRKSEYLSIYKTINTAIASEDAKVFKEVYICNKGQVEQVISDDLDTFINFEEINRIKYTKDNLYGSKVLGYDIGIAKNDKELSIEEVINNYNNEIINEETGFIEKE